MDASLLLLKRMQTLPVGFLDYRERSVPDSPSEVKSSQLNSMSPVTMHRPHSNGSNNSGTGQHSPQSSLSGRTPSPPHGTTTAQQLPPACGARQLSKLKRFLTTLIQFGTDISPEIGERVRSLVLALVNNHLSIEEFHSKLQEATNFPLRPFVIPFLKTNLPLLQRELLHCARMARQTPSQYLQHNEHVIFDPTRAPPVDGGCSDVSNVELNENGKRLRSPDRAKENGVESQIENPNLPAKRAHTISPTRAHTISPTRAHTISPTHVSPGSTRMSPGSARVSPGSLRTSPSTTGAFPPALGPAAPLRLEDMTAQRDMRDRAPRAERDRADRQTGYPRGEHYDVHLERVEDEWKHLENMLHCVMDMVGRCRQALTALQERTRREREELARWVRHQNGVDPEVKKRADYMTESLRHTEDRVTEVRRRAVHVFPEDAVNEVKRQAMLELQKAVAAAEVKANELVAAERAKLEQQLSDATKRAREELMAALNRQEESRESCWNCGRKANETCSGCNTARYCGSFCQHKDWESHHRVCGQPPTNQRQAATSGHAPGGALSGRCPPNTQADDSVAVTDSAKSKMVPNCESSSLVAKELNSGNEFARQEQEQEINTAVTESIVSEKEGGRGESDGDGKSQSSPSAPAHVSSSGKTQADDSSTAQTQ